MDDGLVQYEPSQRNGCVLILVVVEDGLVHARRTRSKWRGSYVLILVVVEDGLVLVDTPNKIAIKMVLILVVVDNGLVRYEYQWRMLENELS